jgi:inner membrane protein
MDSITQIALGSAVGIAVMGRQTSVWKAALWGGLCGTLPDLDVLIDHGDAIRNMTLHRTESHSLFYLSLVSPLLAWLVSRIQRGASFRRWWLATWLALVTHPLLDWLTVYGTQLGLPFTDFPFAVGSIFVIDPLYTLPLAVGVVAAVVAAGKRPGSGRRWNLIGLGTATAYLAWSVVAQAQVSAVARASLHDQGVPAQRLLVVPTPFNTVLWRVLAIDGDSYLEGFYSLLDQDRNIELRRYPRDMALLEQNNWYVDRVAWFSHGYFRMRRDNEQLLISDLRMGQEPSYTFTFTIPPTPQECTQAASRAAACSSDASPATAAAARPRLVPQQVDVAAMLGWLWRRMRGEQTAQPR